MPPATNGPALQPEARISPAPLPFPIVREAPREDMDDALLKELEVSLDNDRGRIEAKVPISLDDEMTRLLGELSSHKR